MKTLQYHKKLPRLVTLISMGLATVPAESFKHKQSSLISNVQYSFASPVSNQLVAIPINDATEKMNKLAELLNSDLNRLKEEWEKHESLFISQHIYEQINKNIKGIDTSLADIKNVLISFSNNDISKKQSILLFGRSLAIYRSALAEVVSFIEQTHQPLKTTNKKPNITDAEMRKLIQSEHTKLGLDTPKFDSN
ncbi:MULTISPECIES: hypothetical protein [Proteus]|uniref:hypothetical protein n=1 Tax=Proteus TaxID=583 RepID=UPI000BFDAB20|nr:MULTISPECIES: hypothetical protein [Proteus]ATM98332.1 hypothetical protein CRN77_00740 [Proteus vulgaris]MBG2838323.1 hypothetical protein [Proteus terrae subsp. cibarius]MBG2867500.1 hypothetical protein [Proteus terrae subsp. cibarius]MBJ2109019.1 hypothetical protein [Proteus terrae]MBJ2132419.1 hypothetical protein [Proteus terrae]